MDRLMRDIPGNRFSFSYSCTKAIRRDRSGDPHGSDAGLRARSAPASREVQSSVGV
jgi:hypothetical protein